MKLIYFLLDIIAVFSRLAFIFQGDYLLPSQVDAKIEDAINEIGQLVDSPGEYLQEFEDKLSGEFQWRGPQELAGCRVQVQSIREKICQQSQGILAQRLIRAVAQCSRLVQSLTWPRGAS